MPPAIPAEDVLPPSRIVRWLFLAGVVLFCAGLYFRYGSNVPPLGSGPATTTTATPDPAR